MHVRDRYDGDAARVWREAANSDELRANLSGTTGENVVIKRFTRFAVGS